MVTVNLYPVFYLTFFLKFHSYCISLQNLFKISRETVSSMIFRFFFFSSDFGKFDSDMDSVIKDSDLVMGLRIQKERMQDTLSIDHAEYVSKYQLTKERLKNAAENFLLFHPGPVNYGIEFNEEIANLDNCKVSHQVANGVGLRMAVLAKLFSEQ